MSFSWKNVFNLLLISVFTLVGGFLGSYGYSAVKRFFLIKSEIENVEKNYKQIEVHPSVELLSLTVDAQRYLPYFEDVFIGDYNGTLNWVYDYRIKIKKEINSNYFISDFFINKCLNVHDGVHNSENIYNYEIYLSDGQFYNVYELRNCVGIVKKHLPELIGYYNVHSIFLDGDEGLRFHFILDLDSSEPDFFEKFYVPNYHGLTQENDRIRNDLLESLCSMPYSFDYGMIFTSKGFDIINSVFISDLQCPFPKNQYRNSILYSKQEKEFMGVTTPDWFLNKSTINFQEKFLDSILE